ncbi:MULTISPECIES: LamG domain-containing protein [unclassified Mucilaginibacter]|uniref:LamG domain-containing protein n=1 Tax=unclassified Mucilaginibacter TaxID=2617802 RepID=UPI00138B6CDB|nr:MULTISPECIES: LamG domain-containing protein [unclassified Mucilaginibacter]MBB5397076.1 hypothetical protein [Mucilaginibacter sp. AK015]QHS54704.1 LamG domain-containing protein [Mucilaginibacter sp. 14171R-50]
MKKLNIYIVTAALVSVGLSSCQKKFDPSTYAPPLSIGGFTAANQVASESLVGYWSFNGSLIDSVSNTEATGVGTAFAKGVKGQAMQGALSSYVLVEPSAAVKNMHSFTIMSWVHTPINANGIVGVVDMSNTSEFWGNMTMFFENGGTAESGNLKIHVRNGAKEAWLGNYAVVKPWDKWINLAVSYSAETSTFIVYANGSKLATQKVDGFGDINFTNLGKMVFGTVQFQTDPSLTSATGKQDWASYLVGQLDEVRIYNKALTPDQVGTIVKLENRGK